MFKFTKTGFACIFISIIFILFEIFIKRYSIETEIGKEIMNPNSDIVNEISDEEKKQEEPVNEKQIWKLEIPKISLNAEIAEGTTQEVLNKYIGHFENTQRENGNIGLAGHNRGYEVNYFKDLKLLKEGDEIIYKYNEFEKIYEVEKSRIIRDTEWEYLENTEDNMLTLITCVENEPEYRRCIQAVEKEEEEY